MLLKKIVLYGLMLFLFPTLSSAEYIVYTKSKLSIPEKVVSGALLIGTNTGNLKMLDPETREVMKEISVGGGVVKDIDYSNERIYVLVDDTLKVYDKSGEFIESKIFSGIASTQSIEIGLDKTIYSAGKNMQSIEYDTGHVKYAFSSTYTSGDVDLTGDRVYFADGNYRVKVMSLIGSLLDEKTFGTNQSPNGIGANDLGVYGINVSGVTRIYNADGSFRCSGGLTGGTKATKIKLDGDYAYAVKANTGHSNHGVYKLRLSDCSLVWDFNKSEGASGGSAVAIDGAGNGYLADGLELYKVSGVDNEEWVYNSPEAIMSLEYMN